MTEKSYPRMASLPYLILSIFVTFGVFAYFFQHISLNEILELIQNSYLPAIFVFLFLSFAGSFVRTWRYSLILNIGGYKPHLFPLFLVVLVRNFFSDILPAKIGSLVYLYLLKSRLGVPLSGATSSFTLSFAFDLVAMAILILLAGLITAGSTVISSTGMIVAGVGIGVLSIAIILNLPQLFVIIANTIPRIGIFRGKEFTIRLSGTLLDAGREIENTKTFNIRFQLLILSLLVRILKYGSLYFLLYALLLPKGYGFEVLNPVKIFIGIAVSESAASLPISGIAGFGAYEGTWAFMFKLLGFPTDLSILTSVSHHLLTQIYGYSLGALSLLLLMLPSMSYQHEKISK